MLALLLAAGAAHPASVEGRLSLMEARQMLEAQQVWALRAELPPEAVKVLTDIQLHVQHDQEQEDRVRELSELVSQMQARLTALELVLADKSLVEGVRIPVAPMQLQALALPSARKQQKKQLPPKAHKQAPAAQRD